MTADVQLKPLERWCCRLLRRKSLVDEQFGGRFVQSVVGMKGPERQEWKQENALS